MAGRSDDGERIQKCVVDLVFGFNVGDRFENVDLTGELEGIAIAAIWVEHDGVMWSECDTSNHQILGKPLAGQYLEPQSIRPAGVIAATSRPLLETGLRSQWTMGTAIDTNHGSLPTIRYPY
ncbi:MAG: hypothetical protein R3E01_22925 [Pirellulaceae bacterium]